MQKQMVAYLFFLFVLPLQAKENSCARFFETWPLIQTLTQLKFDKIEDKQRAGFMVRSFIDRNLWASGSLKKLQREMASCQGLVSPSKMAVVAQSGKIGEGEHDSLEGISDSARRE